MTANNLHQVTLFNRYIVMCFGMFKYAISPRAMHNVASKDQTLVKRLLGNMDRFYSHRNDSNCLHTPY